MIERLDKIKQVFCDDKNILEKLYQNGLDKNSIIYTSSPFLHNNNLPNIYYIPELINDFKIEHFLHDLSNLIFEIYKITSSNKKLKKFSMNIARKVLHSYRIIHQAIYLDNINTKIDTLFVKIDTSNKEYNDLLNAQWSAFFDKKFINIFDYKYTINNEKISFFNKIISTNKNRLKLEIYKLLSNFITTKKRKNIIFFGNNDLMFRTVENLFLEGFNIIHIKNFLKEIDNEKNNIDINYNQILKENIKDAYYEFFNKWLKNKSFSLICFDLIVEEMIINIHKQIQSENWIERKMKNINLSNSAILCNFPRSPEYTGFSNFLNSKNLPLISFQHGVTREISKVSDFYSILDECNIADIVFSYNESYKKITTSTPYSKGQVISIGSIYQKNRFKLKKNNKILFVSMLFLRGNSRNIINKKLNDYQIIKREERLIDLFNSINMNVTYKKYELKFKRYLDDDLIIDKINKSKNVNILKKKIDLKEIVHDYNFLILQGASSTLTYCLSLNIPIIYLFNQDMNLLRDEPLDLMKKSVFFFNENEKEFEAKIINFFKIDREILLKEWKLKKIHRDSLINKFFYKNNNHPEKTASKYISDLLHI